MLFVRTPASKAFRELVKRETHCREKLHLPKVPDLRGYVMEDIYRETSAVSQPNDQALRKLTKSLKKLVEQLGVVIGTISKMGTNLESKGGVSLDLSMDRRSKPVHP